MAESSLRLKQLAAVLLLPHVWSRRRPETIKSHQICHPTSGLIRTTMLVGVMVTLAGCQTAALTAFGIGASTGVQHTLNGTNYRTFTVSEPKVKAATLVALGHMGIKVTHSDKADSGDLVYARANDRDIEVGFEALSPNTTRMKAVAKQGIFYDSATAYEIIIQTEKALSRS